MRILILSDSHYRSLDNIKFNEFDYILHAGDYGKSIDTIKQNGIIYVKGNCDFNGLNEANIKIEDRNVLITHGHLYDVKYDFTRLLFKGLSNKADYVIFGHTHNPTLFIEEGFVFINPGAYQDGYYVIIDEHQITFYKDDKAYKKYKRKW